MTKKRTRSRKPKKHSIQLVVGIFYNVHDGSGIGGHPGRIEFADYLSDIYISTTTGSKTEDEYRKDQQRKNHLELKHATDKLVFKSYVNKRPFLGCRDDYGDKCYSDMKYHEDDIDLINKILKQPPRLGHWYKKKTNKKPS